mmetsp:Transcript_23699/g.74559  ORF Transcript_23699/g.74559 Transcript_23699/m.74559 type:complete len:229 (+) Transcript_23699:410-1096(+)
MSFRARALVFWSSGRTAARASSKTISVILADSTASVSLPSVETVSSSSLVSTGSMASRTPFTSARFRFTARLLRRTRSPAEAPSAMAAAASARRRSATSLRMSSLTFRCTTTWRSTCRALVIRSFSFSSISSCHLALGASPVAAARSSSSSSEGGGGGVAAAPAGAAPACSAWASFTSFRGSSTAAGRPGMNSLPPPSGVSESLASFSERRSHVVPTVGMAGLHLKRQ